MTLAKTIQSRRMEISERPARNKAHPGRILPYAVRCMVATIFILVVTYVVHPPPLEDGYIYSRYISNDLHGLGLVFNAGEHVNALTSPLYSYILLAMAHIAKGHIIACEYLLFAAFLVATCCLAESFFAYSGMLVASMVSFYSVIGMESTMFLFFILLSIWLVEREQYDWLPACLVLLGLVRMEGAAMIPVVAWICFRRNRWPSWNSCMLPLLIVVAYLGLNHYLYGNILPASSTAKIGQGKSGFWGKWPRAFLYGYRLGPDGRPAFWALLPMVAVLPFAWKRLRGTAWQQAAVPFFIILAAFYVFMNIPNYNWYYVPLTMLVVMYATAGFQTFRWGTALVLTLAALQAADTIHLKHAGDSGAIRVTPYSAAADWLNTHTPPDATVESLEIGEFGWHLHRYLYDSLGLTRPKNADHIAHRDFASWLEEDKPDYVLYHTTRPFPFERVIISDPNYKPVTEDTLGIVIYKRTRDPGMRGAPLQADVE